MSFDGENALSELMDQLEAYELKLVTRDKSPEYALYMLNRQTVKNVTLPLVPGEMKVTVVDAATLQVARRGESKSILCPCYPEPDAV